MEKIRLHLLSLPHTITNKDFSHCAFTGKILRFSPMMRTLGYEVYHYGVEGAESGADVQIDLMNQKEWNFLRKKAYLQLNPKATDREADEKLRNPRTFIGDLANGDTLMYQEFNKRLRPLLKANYRARDTDIVCLTFSHAHDYAIEGQGYTCIESGIGYGNSFYGTRVFESYAIMHKTYMAEKKGYQNYWFVAPNYFDLSEWPLNKNKKEKGEILFGYFGRLSEHKGCGIILEIAKRFPQYNFVLCGQGDPTPYVNIKENYVKDLDHLKKVIHMKETQDIQELRPLENVYFMEPIHGEGRGDYLSSLTALIAPSMYVEPFCGVAVEAQLCGTPVLTHDFGAMVETVEQFKTGLRCHSLADFCYGIELAAGAKGDENNFDSNYISERARKKWSLETVAHYYDYIFKSNLELVNGSGGWYTTTSHVDLLPK